MQFDEANSRCGEGHVEDMWSACMLGAICKLFRRYRTEDLPKNVSDVKIRKRQLWRELG